MRSRSSWPATATRPMRPSGVLAGLVIESHRLVDHHATPAILERVPGVEGVIVVALSDERLCAAPDGKREDCSPGGSCEACETHPRQQWEEPVHRTLFSGVALPNRLAGFAAYLASWPRPCSPRFPALDIRDIVDALTARYRDLLRNHAREVRYPIGLPRPPAVRRKRLFDTERGAAHPGKDEAH